MSPVLAGLDLSDLRAQEIVEAALAASRGPSDLWSLPRAAVLPASVPTRPLTLRGVGRHDDQQEGQDSRAEGAPFRSVGRVDNVAARHLS